MTAKQKELAQAKAELQAIQQRTKEILMKGGK